VYVKADSEAEGFVSSDDALRGLCFSDVVFSQRYDGWRVLGRGPWATVVRTRSRDLGHDIALKVFVKVDPELLERVRHEVRAVQTLATPTSSHLQPLRPRTIAWFEMELVDGPNLQEELARLAAAGERSIGRAYEIALAVSRCVWHAHRHGVLHRDIKPANVLLPASRRPAAKSATSASRGWPRWRVDTSRTITRHPRSLPRKRWQATLLATPRRLRARRDPLRSLCGGRPPYEVACGASIASPKAPARGSAQGASCAGASGAPRLGARSDAGAGAGSDGATSAAEGSPHVGAGSGRLGVRRGSARPESHRIREPVARRSRKPRPGDARVLDDAPQGARQAWQPVGLRLRKPARRTVSAWGV